jgi:hypothetical protein
VTHRVIDSGQCQFSPLERSAVTHCATCGTPKMGPNRNVTSNRQKSRNDAVSTAYVTLCRVVWEDDHEMGR